MEQEVKSYLFRNEFFSIKKASLFDFGFKTIVFLAIFDGIRHNSIFYSLSPLKELFTYSLLFFLLYEQSFKIKNPIKYLDVILFSGYLIFVGSFITLGNLDLLQKVLQRDPPINPIALHIKTINFFLLIYLFSNYSKLTGKSFASLVNFSVNLSIAYLIFSILSYFIALPFINEFRPYVGRISSGYPTADSQSLSFALLTLYFVGENRVKFFTTKFILLSLAIIMQATTTGVATLGLIYLSFLFLGKRIGSPKTYKNFVKGLMVLGITVLIGIAYVFTIVDKEVVDSFVSLLSAKSEFIIYYAKLKLLGIDSETSDHFVTATYHVRQEEINSTMKHFNSAGAMIFGKGTALASIIENQFGFVLRAYGYLGLLFYCLFYLGSILRGWFGKRLNVLRICLVMLVLLLTSMSQISSYLFQISCGFAIAYCCVFSETLNQKHS